MAAGFQIGIGLFNTIPSIFVCLFYGALSDRIGRKTIFILSILGSLLEAIIVLLTMYFDWKVWIIFIGSFCNGIGGYLTGILMAVMAYIADTTAADRRAVRLGKDCHSLLQSYGTVINLIQDWLCKLRLIVGEVKQVLHQPMSVR